MKFSKNIQVVLLLVGCVLFSLVFSQLYTVSPRNSVQISGPAMREHMTLQGVKNNINPGDKHKIKGVLPEQVKDNILGKEHFTAPPKPQLLNRFAKQYKK
jgi:hypothetical protein